MVQPVLRYRLSAGTPTEAAALAQLREFAGAFRDGVRLGMVGEPGAGAAAAVAVDWSPDGTIMATVSGGDLRLSPFDSDLLARGVANCLDMSGIDIAGGPPPVPGMAEQYAAALEAQRSRLSCEVVEDEDWRHDETSHVVLEFRDVVDPAAFAYVAGAATVLEKLVWGMYPLPGDVYSDMGETTVVRLEPNVISVSIDGVYALAEDWRRRFEAALIDAGRVRVAVISYEQ